MKRSLAVRIILAFLVCAAALHAAPQDMPQPKKRVDPAYPANAKKNGIEADIDIKVLVNERGTVEKTEVVSASNWDFAHAALDAAAQWQFIPAKKDGRAIKAEVTIPFRFRLPEKEKSAALADRKFLQKIADFLMGSPDVDLSPSADPSAYIIINDKMEHLKTYLANKDNRSRLAGRREGPGRFHVMTDDAGTAGYMVYTQISKEGRDQRFHTIVVMKNENGEWMIKSWHTSP